MMVSFGISHLKLDGDLGEKTILAAPSKPRSRIKNESKISCGKWPDHSKGSLSGFNVFGFIPSGIFRDNPAGARGIKPPRIFPLVVLFPAHRLDYPGISRKE